MKIPQKLGLVAALLFTISYFLPAYGGSPGVECFQACLQLLVKRDTNWDAWFYYYSGFVFSNILFLILVFAVVTTKKSRQLRGLGSLIILLHVMSWPIVNLIDGNAKISEIEVGYYVWLLAYVLLFAVHLVKEPTKSLKPTVGVAVAQL